MVDAGFISDAQEAAQAAEQLRAAGCDLIIMFLTTYMTATMVVPIAQRTGAPLLLLNLQPSEVDGPRHISAPASGWPTAGAVRCPRWPTPSSVAACLSGRCRAIWPTSGPGNGSARWVKAASVRKALRDGRHGLMGHLYPGMYDVSTDLTFVPAMLGGHVEVLEMDDLRVLGGQGHRLTEVAGKLDQVRSVFDIDPSVDAEDLDWAARVSVGLDHLVEDFGARFPGLLPPGPRRGTARTPGARA